MQISLPPENRDSEIIDRLGEKGDSHVKVGNIRRNAVRLGLVAFSFLHKRDNLAPCVRIRVFYRWYLFLACVAIALFVIQAIIPSTITLHYPK